MFQMRLPINLLKIVCVAATVTESSSWAAKHTALVAEKTALVAEYAAYGAKQVAKGIKYSNEWLEKQARETKEECQQAIYKEEFRQINQDIIQGSEKYNPRLIEKTDADFADWTKLEHEECF